MQTHTHMQCCDHPFLVIDRGTHQAEIESEVAKLLENLQIYCFQTFVLFASISSLSPSLLTFLAQAML